MTYDDLLASAHRKAKDKLDHMLHGWKSEANAQYFVTQTNAAFKAMIEQVHHKRHDGTTYYTQQDLLIWKDRENGDTFTRFIRIDPTYDSPLDIHDIIWGFEDESDAIMFRLTWCGS
jgi:hypothetical protein